MISPWLAHGYTASGAVLALLAARAVVLEDYRQAFFWLWLQVVVDATDGVLARRLRVADRLPGFDGGKLDDLVDYLAYVFVPALVVWRAPIVPVAWAVPVASLMLLSSAIAFSRRDAKTADHFFTGFPSYWNVVVFYLLVTGWPYTVNAVVLVTLVVLVVAPTRYLYPSRTPVLPVVTNAFGGAWAILMLLMLWQYPAVSRLVLWASLAFPLYYMGLSFWLHARQAGPGVRANPAGHRSLDR